MKTMIKRREVIGILVFLLIINNLILIAYFFENNITGRIIEKIEINVTRVIDGDTIEAGGKKIRLTGINTPEKNQPYYKEARDFLSKLVGKKVEVEITGKDKYKRNLAYVWFEDKLINEEILKLGLANLYYYNKDSKFRKLEKAEASARKQELGIWKKSSNFGCVKLVKLKYKENKRCNNQEQLILHNSCNSIKAKLKDDANHIYNVQIKDIFVKNFSCIWNNEGDSLYLWDGSGLILFYRY